MSFLTRAFVHLRRLGGMTYSIWACGRSDRQSRGCHSRQELAPLAGRSVAPEEQGNTTIQSALRQLAWALGLAAPGWQQYGALPQ